MKLTFNASHGRLVIGDEFLQPMLRPVRQVAAVYVLLGKLDEFLQARVGQRFTEVVGVAI